MSSFTLHCCHHMCRAVAREALWKTRACDARSADRASRLLAFSMFSTITVTFSCMTAFTRSVCAWTCWSCVGWGRVQKTRSDRAFAGWVPPRRHA